MKNLYANLPPKVRKIGYWLLTLKPGESMDLSPSVFEVRAETLQSYLHKINGIYGRRYRAYGGITRKDGERQHKPPTHCLRVHYLGERHDGPAAK